jgi:hypothetical protein
MSLSGYIHNRPPVHEAFEEPKVGFKLRWVAIEPKVKGSVNSNVVFLVTFPHPGLVPPGRDHFLHAKRGRCPRLIPIAALRLTVPPFKAFVLDLWNALPEVCLEPVGATSQYPGAPDSLQHFGRNFTLGPRRFGNRRSDLPLQV